MKGSSVRACLIGLVSVFFVSAAHAATLSINAGTKQGHVPHFWEECIGSDHMIVTLKPPQQVALKLCADSLGMKRVRGHGILDKDVGIFSWTGTGTPTYTWTNFDAICDYLISINMVPFVELSFMPPDLATSATTNNQLYGSTSAPANVNGPKSYTVWKNFVTAIVQHCESRYGAAAVQKWYWEIWNEPESTNFWTGGYPDGYYELVDSSIAGAHAADPNIMLGGPAGSNQNGIPGLLAHTNKLAFTSVHSYSGGSSGPSANPTQQRFVLTATQTICNNAGMSSLPIAMTEWGACGGLPGGTGVGDHSRDSHYQAGYCVKACKVILDLATAGTQVAPIAFSYWDVSDVFEETSALAPNVCFNSNFGLVTYQGIRKPAFNGFEMLHMMDTTRISMTGGSGDNDGVDGFATVNAAGTFMHILVYNFYQTILTSGNDPVTLSVTNIPSSMGTNIHIAHYRVDSTYSNAYTLWLGQGKPTPPSATQLTALLAAGQLAQCEAAKDTTLTGTSYTKTFTMPRQAVSLIVISKQGATNVIRQEQSVKQSSALNLETSLSGFSGQIRFTIPSLANAEQRVSLQIYDLSGHLIRTLINGSTMTAGTHAVTFDMRDNSGRKLSAGNYICRLRSANVDKSAMLIGL